MSLSALAVGCGDHAFDPDEGATAKHPIPVVGGEVASVANYPSTVALTDPTGEPFCSGTLVSPTLVVTAAHCLQDWWGNTTATTDVRVVYGYETPSSAPSSERRKVAQLVPHPQYDANPPTDADGLAHSNDIGAVVLQQPIDGGVVAPILAADQVDTELTPGRDVDIAGYGIYNYNQQKGGTLYEGITPHVRHIQWEMLAGQPGEPDTCNGDSGGPAYLVVNGALYLTGITSRAWAKSTNACGDGGIYTIASQYVDWLTSVGGELDGGALEGGWEASGSWDASPDVSPQLDASASCLSPNNVCDPVTNEGCDATQGEACRLDSDGKTSCHTGANDQPPGEWCDQTSRFCQPGYHCGASIKCEQYCCSDADCTGGGTCTALMASVGTLGTCGVPPKPDAAGDASQDAQAEDATASDAEPSQDAGLEADGSTEAPGKRLVEGAGCGCSVPSAGGPASGALVLAGLAVGVVLRRRRR